LIGRKTLEERFHRRQGINQDLVKKEGVIFYLGPSPKIKKLLLSLEDLVSGFLNRFPKKVEKGLDPSF